MKKTLLPSSPSIPLPAQPQKPPATGKRLAGLEATFKRFLGDWKASGFAVAVVEEDKVIYARGFGYRDYARKLPVTPNTLFAAGSVTKSFTAALLGQLQQEGKLDYDKPVRQYLPGLSFYNDALNNSVTPRLMLSHLTGLAPHDYSWYLFSTSSRDSLLQRLPFLEPSAGIRERWQYNSIMYAILGVLVEKLTGKSWEENVREKLFAPLGMTRSVFSAQELPGSEDASLGYKAGEDGTIRRMNYYDFFAMAPAGGIFSNVLELANWLTAWINGGKFKGKEVFPAPFVAEAITPQAIVSAALPETARPDIHFHTYGFGWEQISYRGHYRVSHIGDIDGFKSVAAWFPADRTGIVVLSNQEGSPLPDIVLNTLADRLLGLEPYDWNGDGLKAVEKKKAAPKEAAVETARTSHPLAVYAGDYHHPGYGTMMLYIQEDALVARIGKQTFRLRHNNYDVFDALPCAPADGTAISGNLTALPVQFHLDVRGGVESLSVPFEATLPPAVFKKQEERGAISYELDFL